MKCACDVCDETVPEGVPKGRCLFCATKCFRVSTMSGKEVEIVMSRSSREILHNLAAVRPDPNVMVATARQEVATLAVQMLGPVVEYGGKMLIDAVKKKIAGKKE